MDYEYEYDSEILTAIQQVVISNISANMHPPPKLDSNLCDQETCQQYFHVLPYSSPILLAWIQQNFHAGCKNTYCKLLKFPSTVSLPAHDLEGSPAWNIHMPCDFFHILQDNKKTCSSIDYRELSVFKQIMVPWLSQPDPGIHRSACITGKLSHHHDLPSCTPP